MKTVTHILIAAMLSILAASACAAQPDLVVFLVRHAEKTNAGKDPELSPAGLERVGTLVGALRDAELDAVHSSDYVRTRDTATPVADAHDLKVELYNPRELPALVARLRKRGGRHLVVGHSNTTHTMAELLGGKPGSPIDDKSEYDRLYILTVSDDGSSTTVMLRYGKTSS